MCNICKQWFELNDENFYKNVNKNTGKINYHPYCKKCEIEKNSKRQENNKESVKKVKAKWWKKNKDRIYKEHKEHYWEEHIEKLSNYGETYRHQHSEIFKEHAKNRQHKNHKISKEEWIACKQYFNNKCAYCGLPLEKHLVKYRGKIIHGDLHKEHVNDLGVNNLSNCVPSCNNCNQKKKRKTLSEWYNEYNPKFSQERYNKIIKWLDEDYKQYIEEKKPRKKYTKKNLSN